LRAADTGRKAWIAIHVGGKGLNQAGAVRRRPGAA
jgi:hypothetical protein